MLITLFVNNKQVYWDISPDDFLADSLRTNGFTSVKTGCSEGACGSCTVLVDDIPLLSCEVLTIRMEGKHITTIEGIPQEARQMAECMLNHGAEACGYCSPGFILLVVAMKRELGSSPTHEEMKQYLNGNLCRCTGYISRNLAVEDFLKL